MSTITTPMAFCLRDGKNLFSVSEGVDCGLALSNATYLMALAQELCSFPDGIDGGAGGAVSFLIEAAMALVDSVNLTQQANPQE